MLTKTIIPKLSLLGCLILGITACSSIDSKSHQVSSKQNINQPPTTLIIPIHQVSSQGVGNTIGTVSFQQTDKGLLITPMLQHLSSGEHGFHIHESASCETALKDGKMVAALAAGGHFNPEQVEHHGTPETGHLGDLPVLQVDADGEATTAVIAPRLKLSDVQNRSIMIHAGGDNYADDPLPLGGGGARIACGVIQ